MSGPGGRLPPGIEGVLFDLDGTLADTQSAWRTAFSEVLASAYARCPTLAALGPGADVHDRLFQSYVLEAHAAAGGEWDPHFLRCGFRRLLAEHAEPGDALADELYERYRRFPIEVELFEDAAPTLEALQGRSRLGLISNGRGPEQRSRIALLGLDAYFTVVAVSGELGVRKPDPAIFRHALDLLGVAAEAAVFVGDDLEADIGGAQAAGLTTVWVNRGGTPRRDHVDRPVPSTPAPDAEISTLSEVLALLGVVPAD